MNSFPKGLLTLAGFADCAMNAESSQKSIKIIQARSQDSAATVLGGWVRSSGKKSRRAYCLLENAGFPGSGFLACHRNHCMSRHHSGAPLVAPMDFQEQGEGRRPRAGRGVIELPLFPDSGVSFSCGVCGTYRQMYLLNRTK